MSGTSSERLRRSTPSFVVALAALFAVGGAFAANINGTPKNDTLRGSAKPDKIYGKGGNDKLYGLAGNDVLNGGPGNDLVVGGVGADVLVCGPGADTATADARDKVGKDCEKVIGLPKPGVSIADASLAEGNGGTTTMALTVTLAKASRLKATVSYASADGTATAGTDYTAASGTLVFNPGETSKSLGVAVLGDTAFEPDETFTLAFSNPVNATLARATATGTIKNDDVAKPKAGRYAGTTSQGKTFTIDVNADITGITAINTLVDLTCQEAPVVFRNFPLNLSGFAPITSDFKFQVTVSQSDPTSSLAITINGSLAVGAPATGTLRVDLTLNTSSGPVHCSTGDATWTASPPA